MGRRGIFFKQKQYIANIYNNAPAEFGKVIVVGCHSFGNPVEIDSNFAKNNKRA